MALLDRSLREFLDDVAAQGRTPGGGSAAALVTALAAALPAKIARTSTAWPQGRGIAAQAESLRDRAAPLAQADAEEYEAALLALEDDGGEAGERRDFALGRAYARAAEPPPAPVGGPAAPDRPDRGRRCRAGGRRGQKRRSRVSRGCRHCGGPGG